MLLKYVPLICFIAGLAKTFDRKISVKLSSQQTHHQNKDTLSTLESGSAERTKT